MCTDTDICWTCGYMLYMLTHVEIVDTCWTCKLCSYDVEPYSRTKEVALTFPI